MGASAPGLSCRVRGASSEQLLFSHSSQPRFCNPVDCSTPVLFSVALALPLPALPHTWPWALATCSLESDV